MKTKKPLIGVTGPSKGGHMAWIFTALSILKAGGRAVRLRHKSKIVDKLDAVVLGGGHDVHPSKYNQQPRFTKNNQGFQTKIKQWLIYPVSIFTGFLNKNHNYDQERDEMEIFYIKNCIDQFKPILGICRGHQLINVYNGGELNQSIMANYKDNILPVTLLPRVKIKVLINTLFKSYFLKANSLHSQVVSEPGRDLIVTAIEDKSELIQATEGIIGSSKVKSVQWHPEYLIYSKQHSRLFEWLIEEAR